MKLFTGLAFLVLSLNVNAAFITFDESNLSGHGAQATSGGFNVTNGGLNLEVFGNYWASLAPIDISTLNNSILSFDFMTTNVGEINGIGFDNDGEIRTGGLVFNFGGTQSYGNQDFARALTANVWYNITIDLANYDLTSFNRMLFIADQDQSGRSTTSNFRNLLVTTPSNVVDVPEPGTALMLALVLAGLGFSARQKR
ncbi:PEP-CTERM sorting domain-containing protein [Alteromonas macleodii]|uniref:YD repeat protein n=1 Tax=Alteromonas macleodii (strain English Channel 673) TaxID=1004788 RepID=A0AB32ZX04_ALTME|nr:PEP-CTERM sorting domain-containing protein [Alteromonas macleodii]AFT74188.1 YD repeat protein [Alteromonas macleodii str. 'English Channel 673']MBL3810106.1 PEP-CTERM sorting domain-containing protein [Alteromonas macleodii]MBL3883643.1 PEP-CTERM sorting domain-containing protein [Alteromonas macleodii]